MVNFESIASVPLRSVAPELKGATEPTRKDAPQAPADAVQFSSKSEEAAAVARIRARAEERQSEIREEKVQQAKQRIEEGTYRLQEVLLTVAGRLTKYVAE